MKTEWQDRAWSQDQDKYRSAVVQSAVREAEHRNQEQLPFRAGLSAAFLSFLWCQESLHYLETHHYSWQTTQWSTTQEQSQTHIQTHTHQGTHIHTHTHIQAANNEQTKSNDTKKGETMNKKQHNSLNKQANQHRTQHHPNKPPKQQQTKEQTKLITYETQQLPTTSITTVNTHSFTHTHTHTEFLLAQWLTSILVYHLAYWSPHSWYKGSRNYHL